MRDRLMKSTLSQKSYWKVMTSRVEVYVLFWVVTPKDYLCFGR